jgi:hypothetical protein
MRRRLRLSVSKSRLSAQLDAVRFFAPFLGKDLHFQGEQEPKMIGGITHG